MPKSKSAYLDVLALPMEARDVSRVYAVGDIHGRFDLLQRMDSLIQADLRACPTGSSLVCFLGDYIDRGPDSARVVEWLTREPVRGQLRVCLRGNHEQRLLDFLEEPAYFGPTWVRFGGREALQSYGVSVPSHPTRENWNQLGRALDQALPDAHRRFLEKLPLALRWDRFLFVHAGLNPECPLEAQPVEDLLWIREPFLDSERDWGFVVVHGHHVVERPEFRPNRIGVDTGAFASDRLTSVVIEDARLRLLQT